MRFLNSFNSQNVFVKKFEIKSFQQDDQGLCVASGQNPSDESSEVDPNQTCDISERVRFILLPCKNNCRGGNNL